MSSITQQEEEATQAISKFDAIYNYCKLENFRLQFIIDFFTRFSALMKQIIPSLQQTTYADIQHVAKIKQEIASDSLFGICSNLSRSHYGLYEEFNYSLKFLGTEAIPYLKAQHQQVEDKINEYFKQ